MGHQTFGACQDTPELIAYWEQVGQSSPHLHSQQPCITDAYCRNAVWRLFSRYLGPAQDLKVFKLDLYNEATWTQYTRYFFERNAPVYAIDISPEIIALACRRVADAGFRPLLKPSQADFRRIPFADNSFDVTFSYGSIEHVAEWRLALRDQVRVTRAGGLILVGVPNLLNIWLKPLLQRVLESLGVMGKYMNREIHFPWWRIRKAVAELDVTDVRVHGVQILPKPVRFFDLVTENCWAGSESRLARRFMAWKRAALRPLLTISKRIERRESWINLFAGDTIVVKATKR